MLITESTLECNPLPVKHKTLQVIRQYIGLHYYHKIALKHLNKKNSNIEKLMDSEDLNFYGIIVISGEYLKDLEILADSLKIQNFDLLELLPKFKRIKMRSDFVNSNDEEVQNQVDAGGFIEIFRMNDPFNVRNRMRAIDIMKDKMDTMIEKLDLKEEKEVMYLNLLETAQDKIVGLEYALKYLTEENKMNEIKVASLEGKEKATEQLVLLKMR